MWLRWLDRRRQIYYAPSQWKWVRDRVGLTEEECTEAAWLVTAAGETFRGAAAISKTFDALFHTGQLFYKIYSLPLLRQFYDYGYNLLGKNRRHFSRLLNLTLSLFGRDVTAAVRQNPPWDPM